MNQIRNELDCLGEFESKFGNRLTHFSKLPSLQDYENGVSHKLRGIPFDENSLGEKNMSDWNTSEDLFIKYESEGKGINLN